MPHPSAKTTQVSLCKFEVLVSLLATGIESILGKTQPQDFPGLHSHSGHP
jgi:hypothetical protein